MHPGEATREADYGTAKAAETQNGLWPDILLFSFNRAEAKQYFESKGFFRSWDDRVLDLHVRFGLRPLSIPPPTVEDHQANSGGTSAASAAPANRASQSPEELLKGPCTLSCNKWHEACAFGSSWMSAYAWSALESQRNKGKTHVIVMSETHIYDRERGEIEKLRDLVGEGKGSSEVMEGGHLVAQEQPDLLGEYEERRASVPEGFLTHFCVFSL